MPIVKNRTDLIATTSQFLMNRQDLAPEVQQALAQLVVDMRRQANEERKVLLRQSAENARDCDAAVALANEHLMEQQKELTMLRGLLEQSQLRSQATIQTCQARIQELEQEMAVTKSNYNALVQAQRAEAKAPRRIYVSFSQTPAVKSNQIVVATNINYAQKLLDCVRDNPGTSQSGKTLVIEKSNIEINCWRTYGSDLFLQYYAFGQYFASYFANIDINSGRLSDTLLSHWLAVQTLEASVDMTVKTTTVRVVDPVELETMRTNPSTLANIQMRNTSIRALGEMSVRSEQSSEMGFFKPKPKSTSNTSLVVGTNIQSAHKLREVKERNFVAESTGASSSLTKQTTRRVKYKNTEITISSWRRREADLELKFDIFGKSLFGYLNGIDIESPHLSRCIFLLAVAFFGVDAQIETGAIPTDAIVDSSELSVIEERASKALSPSSFALIC